MVQTTRGIVAGRTASSIRHTLSRMTLMLGLALAGVGCADDATGTDARRPQLTGIAPQSIVAGSAPATVRVTGAHFVERSIVRSGDVALATTFVGPTELTAQLTQALTRTPGALSISVETSAPGGGSSDTLVLERVNVVPTIESIVHDTVSAGTNLRAFSVFGTGFSSGSQVEFGGVAVTTNYVSGTELSFNAIGAALATVRRVGVRVRNPMPNGGLSVDSVIVTVIEPIPVLDAPAFGGFTVGTPDTEIDLTGRNFGANTVVEWNGSQRIPTLVEPNRLRIAVTASDFAAPGTVTIRAIGPPNAVQGERISNVLSVPLRALGALVPFDSVSVPMVARRMLWDPAAARFVLMFGSDGESFANTVARFNVAGAFVDSLSFPGFHVDLVRSENSEFLYLASLAPNRVYRVAIPAMTRDISINTGGEPTWVLPVPGQSRAVIVASGFFAQPSVMSVFDDATRREQQWSFQFIPTAATKGSVPGEFYGSETWTSNRGFYTFYVSATGVSGSEPTLFSGSISQPFAVGRKVFHMTGRIDGPTKQLDFTWAEAGFFVVDQPTGRVFRIRNQHIEILDAWGGAKIGEIPVPVTISELNEFSRIVRWGPDGLAVLSGTRLFILRSAAVAP